jgi:hypothetical protein
MASAEALLVGCQSTADFHGSDNADRTDARMNEGCRFVFCSVGFLDKSNKYKYCLDWLELKVRRSNYDRKSLAVTRRKEQIQQLGQSSSGTRSTDSHKARKDAVVVLSIEEYKKLTKPKKNLVQFFHDSPLTQEDISLERSREKSRDIIL